MSKSGRVINVLLVDGSPSGLHTLHEPTEIVPGTVFLVQQSKCFLTEKREILMGYRSFFGNDEDKQSQIYIGHG